MNFQIDPKIIEAAVTEAVVKSSIGASLQKAVDEAFNSGYNRGMSAFQTAVNGAVAKSVAALLDSEEYKTAIEARVREKLTKEAVDKVCENVVSKILNAAWSY